MDPFVAGVDRFSAQEQLFRRVKTVLVAISGGADSTACLLAMLDLRERLGLEIIACHFNHMLRAESGADLVAVRALCERLAVPCLSGEGDVASFAAERRMGVEEAARRMRYQFLSFVAAEKRADCIATGHTADDQAETVLMRVLRGSGVRGIRGMLPSGPVPGAAAMRLVRPLLWASRAQTEAFCAAREIVPLVDPSNDDLAMTRNRLRHETLPALRALNPSVRDALLGLAASAREVFDGVEKSSYSAQPLTRTPVGAIFALGSLAALGNEALTLVIEREASFFKIEPEVNRTRVENCRAVLERKSGEVRFGDICLQASCGKVRIGPPLEQEPLADTVLSVPGATLADARWRIEVASSALAERPGAALAAFDGQAVRGLLRARLVRPGDRMHHHGLERRVADVLANAKVPAWDRLGLVAIADSERVHVLFSASGTFEADRAPEVDPWYLRLTAIQPR